jgi:hypothetical protein
MANGNSINSNSGSSDKIRKENIDAEGNMNSVSFNIINAAEASGLNA